MDLIPEPHAESHIKILTSEVMAQGPTRSYSSLFSTLVSPRSLKPCICLDLASMHTLGVLDNAPSSSVSSWYFSILTLDNFHIVGLGV